MTREDLARKLVEFIQQNYAPSSGYRITYTSPLLSAGVVDSFAIPEIIAMIEKWLCKSVDISGLYPEDFETIESLVGKIW